MYFKRIYFRMWKSWEYKNRTEFVISKGSQYCNYFGMDKDHNKVSTEELFLFKNGFVMRAADFLVKLLKILKPKQELRIWKQTVFSEFTATTRRLNRMKTIAWC